MTRWPFREIRFIEESEAKEPTTMSPHPHTPITLAEWEEIKADALTASRTSRAYARLYAEMVRAEKRSDEVVRMFDAADAFALSQVPQGEAADA